MSYTLQQLRHFVAVAETGSISRAAERCHISQPSLSNSLKKLSDSLDCQLLVRLHNGVSLSADGDRFLRHAHQILSAVERAREEMLAAPRSLTGVLRLGVTDSFTGSLLPALLMQARQHFPKVALEVFENERAWMQSALLDDRIDLSLLLISHVDPNEAITIEPLIASPRKLWTSAEHPILQREAISLKDVAESDFILLDRDEHEQSARKYWQAYGLTPNIVLRSKSVEAIRSLVAEGYGLTILSDLTYREWSNDGARVVRRTLTDPIPSMDLGLAYRSGSASAPIVKAFIPFIKTFIRTFAARIG